ncbi:MAG TPA: hypothetical protein ENK19_06250 [Acidobacteria bacterium]|nr:hypothetical protein [Acidobacteriota bacterium]
MNELDRLVARLADLHDGESAFFDVIQAGPEAIPALEALVREEPQSVFAHRCLAVDALAAIGGPDAWQALLGALEELSTRRVPSSLALAEDAVVNRIATHLAGSGTPGASEALLAALAARPRGEVARALGRLHEERAIPMLVACLDDDLARDGAMEALQGFGEAAAGALAAKLTPPGDAGQYEAPHLTAGRAAAAQLLGGIALPDAHVALGRALHDPSPVVRRAAALALAVTTPSARHEVVPVLIEALGDASWLAAEPVIDALVSLGRATVGPLLDVLTGPAGDPSVERRRERTLRALARLAPEEAVPAIGRLAAGGSDPRTAIAAVAALAAIPSAAATTALASFLRHPTPAVRERTVRALAGRGPDAARAMTTALSDRERHIRHTVWTCAAALDPAGRAAFLDAVSENGHLIQRLEARLRLRAGAP